VNGFQNLQIPKPKSISNPRSNSAIVHRHEDRDITMNGLKRFHFKAFGICPKNFFKQINKQMEKGFH
jgi:hypothetical protein